jgi:hypothetical protein
MAEHKREHPETQIWAVWDLQHVLDSLPQNCSHVRLDYIDRGKYTALPWIFQKEEETNESE